MGRDSEDDEDEDEDEETPDNLGRQLARLAPDFQGDPDLQELVNVGLLPASIVDWLRIDYVGWDDDLRYYLCIKRKIEAYTYEDLNLGDGTLSVTQEEQQAFRDFFAGVKLPYQQPEWHLGVLWF